MKHEIVTRTFTAQKASLQNLCQPFQYFQLKCEDKQVVAVVVAKSVIRKPGKEVERGGVTNISYTLWFFKLLAQQK